MQFNEKLFKLRKEKGLSQEALAEKLNTTRQAVSKWENGQGFPETEKLLMIGNIFEVSIDYLLKDTTEQSSENEKGYYVSKEMAEGYLAHEHKMAKHLAGGISILILSPLPYLIFKDAPTIYLLLTIIIATLGIGIIVTGGLMEEDRYNIIKKETLLIDQCYLKELKSRYENIRKKYTALIVAGSCSVIIGVIPFLLSKKEFIALEVAAAYYPICVFFISIGAYFLILTMAVLEPYEIIAKNEEYTKRVGFKFLKKVGKKIDDLLR